MGNGIQCPKERIQNTITDHLKWSTKTEKVWYLNGFYSNFGTFGAIPFVVFLVNPKEVFVENYLPFQIEWKVWTEEMEMEMERTAWMEQNTKNKSKLKNKSPELSAGNCIVQPEMSNKLQPDIECKRSTMIHD